MKPLLNAKKGQFAAFTLVEVVIVVAVLGVLAIIAMAGFTKARSSTQVKVCISNLKPWSLILL